MPPGPEAPEEELLLASSHSGTCRACRVDVEQQRESAIAAGREEADLSIIPRRSFLNVMDPLHGFPYGKV